MSRDNFFTRIIRLIKTGRWDSKTAPADQLSAGPLKKLYRMVEDTVEVEIGCDDVFKLLDWYVELAARGEDVADLFPLVKQHLDRCRDCNEEFEALARLFEATSLQNN